MRIPEDDLEQQMEALRHFKLAHSLRVAASEFAGTLPLMKVSDYLTWLAEAILEQVLALAWRHTVAKHGTPKRADGSDCDPDFIIVGYGKVGGIELGHGSDLDLVFIHDGDPQAETDGAKPIDGTQFFTRLGQRIIHLLTTQTTSGQLYEVDMRLRPSGDAGLLVSSLAAFERYQQQEAWTWEHQALVRARVLVGSPRVAQCFEQVRGQVLGRARDLQKLQAEVSEMRAKMRDNLGPGPPTPDVAKTPSTPRRASISSRMPVVSSISNLWCNTRPWPGRTSTRSCSATPTTFAFWTASARPTCCPKRMSSYCRRPTRPTAPQPTAWPCRNNPARCRAISSPIRAAWCGASGRNWD